jgi:hypothetical protein
VTHASAIAAQAFADSTMFGGSLRTRKIESASDGEAEEAVEEEQPADNRLARFGRKLPPWTLLPLAGLMILMILMAVMIPV